MYHNALTTYSKHGSRLRLEKQSHHSTGQSSDLLSFFRGPLEESSTSCCFANGTGRNWFGLDPICLRDFPVLLAIMSSFCESYNFLWFFSPLSLPAGAVIFSKLSCLPKASHSEARGHELGRHSVQPVKVHLLLKIFSVASRA